MKKFYPGFSTLICLSFLFTLDSCTTDPAFVLDDTLGNVDTKNGNPYYNSIKGDVGSANLVDPYASADGIQNKLLETYHASDSISTYSTTEADNIIDPDWKKLITHFTDSSGITE